MEVENASMGRQYKYKYKTINLKISKDRNNQNWLVSQTSGKNTFTTVPKRAQKPTPSLKISLPIIHYLKAMQQYKNTNPGSKIPDPNHTEVRRLPQESGLPSSKPLPLCPSSLRMFRHPVPTSKGRTIMFTDKVDKIVRAPESIKIKTTSKGDPNIADSNLNTPLIKEPVKQKTEELKSFENKTNTTVEMLYKGNFDVVPSIKHKLPLTVAAPKRCYGSRTSNPVNKENRLSTSTHTPTTAVQATQTENVFIVTEEGYQIIETIRTSGLTVPDLQNLIDNIEKQRAKNNDNDCDVIDLESTDENRTSKDILDIVMKHSSNNKNVLQSAAQILQLLSVQNHQPSLPVLTPPDERTSPYSDQQSLLPAIFEPSPSGNSVPYADMVNSFMVLVTLQQHGFRFTNNSIEPPQIYVQRTNAHTTQASTQTEDENNNVKRKRYATDENSSELVNIFEQNNFQRPSVVTVRPGQELPVEMPQQQEMSAFPPHMQRQLPQTQIQHFVPEHVERPAQFFPSNLPGLMPQQRNLFIMPRNHHQYSTPQIQVQMPTPVQLPSTVHMHHSNPRSQAMQSRLSGLPRLARVLSTQEANLHTQAAQHPECNWSFPQYIDRHGNVFPQRHQQL